MKQIWTSGRILILIFTLMILGCRQHSTFDSHGKTVMAFYNGLNRSDFASIREHVSDSIRLVREGSMVVRSIDELYHGFRWDSVFSPEYRLSDIESDGDTLELTIAKTDRRLKFLQDTAIVYRARISLSENKIAVIDIYEYILLDLPKLQARTDSLISWINTHHPSLSGFLNDTSLNGARNYLKAIELYSNQE